MNEQVYTVFWMQEIPLEEGLGTLATESGARRFAPCATHPPDLNSTLAALEDLRKRRREGENITFITMCSENPDVVGQAGVDSVVDGKTPDGVAYDWVKRRPFKE